jgi:hypothetical protein
MSAIASPLPDIRMDVPVMSTVFPAWREPEDELRSLSNPGSSANLLIFVSHCATGICDCGGEPSSRGAMLPL